MILSLSFAAAVGLGRSLGEEGGLILSKKIGELATYSSEYQLQFGYLEKEGIIGKDPLVDLIIKQQMYVSAGFTSTATNKVSSIGKDGSSTEKIDYKMSEVTGGGQILAPAQNNSYTITIDRYGWLLNTTDPGLLNSKDEYRTALVSSWVAPPVQLELNKAITAVREGTGPCKGEKFEFSYKLVDESSLPVVGWMVDESKLKTPDGIQTFEKNQDKANPLMSVPRVKVLFAVKSMTAGPSAVRSSGVAYLRKSDGRLLKAGVDMRNVPAGPSNTRVLYTTFLTDFK